MYNDAFPLPQIEWLPVMPIITVVLTGIIGLLVEIVKPKKSNSTIITLCLLGLGLTAVELFLQISAPEAETMADMFVVDRFGVVMQLLVVVSCGLCVAFSEEYLRQKRINFGEFYPMLLWSSAGAMLMATSRNLLVIFLGLEVLSIALYVMAGLSRSEEKSEESAVKYFLLGAFASGFFLYGIAFLYGASGSLRIDAIGIAWASGPASHPMILFGVALILVGLSFKSAFVPFHQWTPDVYQGAPTNVTAFMAAGSKIAAIAALYRVLEASTRLSDYWLPALAVVAVLTMTVGNLIALLQKDVKRILGYSSIAHAGYILVAILAHTKAASMGVGNIGFSTTAFYLLSYALMTIGAFAVVSLAAKSGQEKTTLTDLHGLYRRSPFAATMLVIFMASLIGIPPTAGFVGKLLIFQDALQAHLTWLAIILAVNSIISISYYLAIARAAFVADEGAEQAESASMGPGIWSVSAICAAGVFLAVLLINPLMGLLGNGISTPSSPAATAQSVDRSAVSMR